MKIFYMKSVYITRAPPVPLTPCRVLICQFKPIPQFVELIDSNKEVLRRTGDSNNRRRIVVEAEPRAISSFAPSFKSTMPDSNQLGHDRPAPSSE